MARKNDNKAIIMKRLLFFVVLIALLTSACSKKAQNGDGGSVANDGSSMANDGGSVAKIEANAPDKVTATNSLKPLTALPEHLEKAECVRAYGQDALDPVTRTKLWSQANNRLGLQILQIFHGNAVISPFSLERSMGMVIDGACGATFEELTEGMGLPQQPSLSEAGGKIEAGIRQFKGKAEFVSDNRLWVRNGMLLRKDYVAAIKEQYSEPTYLDFAKDPEGAARTINEAIEKATNGRMQNFVDKGEFNDATTMLLTNALYFKAAWLQKDLFKESDTKKEDFYNDHGKVSADMMHRTFSYGKDIISVHIRDAFVAVRIPFEGFFVYTAVLPILKQGESPEAALRRAEEVFLEKYEEVFANPWNVQVDAVHLAMPKFEMEVDAQLQEVLEKMGIIEAWDAFGAAEGDAMIDFTGMNGVSSKTASGEGLEFLYLDKAKQKVFIKIDEKGGEAAAITSARLAANSAPILTELDVTLNRPFLFMISSIAPVPGMDTMDKPVETVLFAGQMVDPNVSRVTLSPADALPPVEEGSYPESFYKKPVPYRMGPDGKKQELTDLLPSGRPALKFDVPTVNGGIDKRIIQKVVRQHVGEIRSCYEREFAKDSSLTGRVVMVWIVNPDGSVSKAMVKETTLRNKKVEECLKNSVLHWRFPAPKGGGLVQVEYPFVFERKE